MLISSWRQFARPIALPIALAGALFAVLTGSAAAQPVSGVEGVVWLAPSCSGPQREGADCRAPYADAEIRLITADGAGAGSTRTAADGRFRLPAPPGKYRLQVVVAVKITRCASPAAVVAARAFTAVEIDCDSGMR